MRPKAAAEAARVLARCSQTWAMLIKRVYEIDPLACFPCGGQTKVTAFVEPPQADVIEKILRHCGLWHPSTPRAPPAGDGWVPRPGRFVGRPDGLFRRVPGTDVREHRHVRGHLLVFTDARRHRDVPRASRDLPSLCGLIGRSRSPVKVPTGFKGVRRGRRTWPPSPPHTIDKPLPGGKISPIQRKSNFLSVTASLNTGRRK